MPESPDRRARLKHRNLLLMILFSVVSLGLYYPIWFVRRRAALNQLDSPRKLPLWPYLVYFAIFGVQLTAIFLDPTPGVDDGDFITDNLVFTLFRYAVLIVMVIQAFAVKDMLEDHLAGPDGVEPAILRSPVTLSGVLTFILGIFYLQHAINTNLAALTELPADGAVAAVPGVQ